MSQQQETRQGAQQEAHQEAHQEAQGDAAASSLACRTGLPCSPRGCRVMCIIGWTITVLLALFLLMGGVMNVLMTDFVVESTKEAGLPLGPVRAIGAVLILCCVLYVLPWTAVLGAVLLTGYFGGACAVHVIKEDPLHIVFFPVVFGVVAWLGIYLREPRLRGLMPVRKI